MLFSEYKNFVAYSTTPTKAASRLRSAPAFDADFNFQGKYHRLGGISCCIYLMPSLHAK